MKKIHRYIASTLTVCSLLALTACQSCSTGPTPASPTATFLAPLLTGVVAGGLDLVYVKYPTIQPYVSNVGTAISQFVLSTNLAYTDLQKVLNAVDNAGLPASVVKQIDDTIVDAYKWFTQQLGAVQDNGSLVILLQAVVTGINQSTPVVLFKQGNNLKLSADQTQQQAKDIATYKAWKANPKKAISDAH